MNFVEPSACSSSNRNSSTPASSPDDDPGEVGDVADRLAALVLRVADVEDVVAAGLARGRGSQRRVQHLGIGDAGAAPLLGDLQRRAVGQPVRLMLHQDARGERIVIGGKVPAARQVGREPRRVARQDRPVAALARGGLAHGRTPRNSRLS